MKTIHEAAKAVLEAYGAPNPGPSQMLSQMSVSDWETGLSAAIDELREAMALPAGPVPAQDDAESKVRALLWNDYPICCGNFQSGEWHMGMREPDQCCGSPDRDMLGDADIVKALRDLFPEQAASPSPAVAQPVADERVPCEACYGIGSSEGNFDGADGGDCYVCDGTGKVLPLKNERVRFEVAHAGMDLECMSDKDGGYYIHRITQAKWEAWQARAALCQPAEEGGKA